MTISKSLIVALTAAVLSMLMIVPTFALTVTPNDSYEWVTTEDTQEVSCLDENGDPITGWAIRDKKDIYYFDKNGYMKTGWVKYKGGWYYLHEETGILVTDSWVDNYYVDTEGKMTKKKK